MSLITETSTSVDTVVPQITIGQIMVSADRKSTPKVKLTDAERIRRIVLPAGHWGNYAATLEGSLSQSLQDLLRVALQKIAGERLRDTLVETNDTARSVPLKDYTISALLTWNAETAVSRGSITFTKEEVLEWFKDSATATAVTAKHGAKAPAILSFLTTRFGALAAKNHGLAKPEDATKLAALIAPADLEGENAALVTEIIGRLESIVKALTAKQQEESVSMDDI